AAERQSMTGAVRIDGSVLRSPKVLMGMLLVLLLIGMGIASIINKRPTPTVDATDLMKVRARRSVTIAANAMTFFRIHTKRWPSQERGLDELSRNFRVPGWKGPYINRVTHDPWGVPYVYRMPLSPFEAPELFSCGPDKTPDTNDDIAAAPEDFVCNEGAWHRDPEPEESAPLSTEETP
ncbi:MAG: type II secretion system protein GspG, partial [Elusimicrobiales bacterium]|nr:type II secretion system protein GspG [Elusimicrobiales bacterium]